MRSFVKSYQVISSIGKDVESNMNSIIANETGLVNFVDYNQGFKYPVGLLSDLLISDGKTRFESLLSQLIESYFLGDYTLLKKSKTLVILCSTKGNIECLDKSNSNYSIEKSKLDSLKYFLISNYYLKNKPLIVSNACISGVSGLVWAKRYLTMGYEDVIVIGADVLSQFVVSGFHSFMALSEEVCKPFDANRKGLNLGEAAGIVHVTNCETDIEIIGGAISDDANHISGPSRTGEGLQIGVRAALLDAGIDKSEIDFVSAHGTATNYNDEMEAKGMLGLEMLNVPINSFKGYVGHTLGAAGIIESIFCFESMKRNMMYKSLGYSDHGVTEAINVVSENLNQECNTVLKLASGFGGGNASLIFRKN